MEPEAQFAVSGREHGFVRFKEGDEVRVDDDARLAPQVLRGQIGTIASVDRFLVEPIQISDKLVAVDRYQQLVKQPRETEILGLALQVFFPKLGDKYLVASNEVTLLEKYMERCSQLQERIFSRLRNPQDFCVLRDGSLEAAFVNQSLDAPLFGDIIRLFLRPKLRGLGNKVVSPEASGPPIGALFAGMTGLSFIRAIKVSDRTNPNVPASWRGFVVSDTSVVSPTKKVKFFFAIPEGALQDGDQVLLFDDIGFTGNTRLAIVELVEKAGAKVTGIVNIVEKFYAKDRREDIPNLKAVIGIDGYEPTGERTCRLFLRELFTEKCEPPQIVEGVAYDPERSLNLA